MYRRALVPVALAALVVLTVAGTALALLGADSTSTPSDGVVFEVGDAGTVLVRDDGDELRVADVINNPGWDYQINRAVGSGVEVAFQSSRTGIEFQATTEGSQVVGQIRIVNDGA